MLWAGGGGALEVRASADGATRLRGRFPYNKAALLSGGPSRRREVFSARAFAARIEAGDDVLFLVHHDMDRPLASRAAGSLTLHDGDDALEIEAVLAPEMREVGYVRDFLGTLAAGLVRGLSPGFTVPEGGDQVKRDGDGLIRVVRAANLVEISAVTKPAYPEAQIEARCWRPSFVPVRNVRNRWRP